MSEEKRSIKQSFKIFEAGVDEWVDVFSLYEYELYKKQESLEGIVAECRADVEAMNCSLLLTDNKKELDAYTNVEINDTALHEVLELLLFEIREMIPKAFPEWMVNKAFHTVIQKIINAFKFGKIQVVNEILVSEVETETVNNE